MIIGAESEQIEFKKTTGERKEALESICSILNKHCKGTLYFGVDDNGYARGQQISDSTKKDISRWIAESIYPKITPTIEVQNIEDKTIIAIKFSGHNRPYSVNGDFLIRTGTENRKMSTDELRRLIKHDDYSSHWEEELTPYSSKDIDEESLFDFYNSATQCGRLELKEYNKDKLLSILDLVDQDGYLKNAGFALFGSNVKIGLKLASYATDNKVTILDLKIVNGNIYNLVGTAISYILSRINWRIEIGTRKRNEIPEIPERAIREIIVNSFAHADYESIPEIEIGIHPGKIEIYNPGTFPDDLTPIDFISKNISSFKRNKIILDVLFRSKDVEKAGTGFQRVNELCKQSGVSWDYRKEAYGFFFEFIRPNVHINVHTNEELSELEQLIYNLIDSNDKITKVEMGVRAQKSKRTIQRIIASLTQKGLIERVGSNKYGYWKVTK